MPPGQPPGRYGGHAGQSDPRTKQQEMFAGCTRRRAGRRSALGARVPFCHCLGCMIPSMAVAMACAPTSISPPTQIMHKAYPPVLGIRDAHPATTQQLVFLSVAEREAGRILTERLEEGVVQVLHDGCWPRAEWRGERGGTTAGNNQESAHGDDDLVRQPALVFLHIDGVSRRG